jgi:transposase
VYARQTRKAGVVKWLEDGIAADLPCEDTAGVVLSMVVDDKGRPHIAYVVAAVGVLYATRFDR